MALSLRSSDGTDTFASIARSTSDEETPLLKPHPGPDTKPRSSDSRATSQDGLRDTSPRTDEETAGSLYSPCAERDSKPSAEFIGIISVLLLGCFLANADGSIVLATYGTISSEIDSLDNGSWIVVTYSLAMCAIQPTVSFVSVTQQTLEAHLRDFQYGKLSDLYGRRGTLIVAYTFFTVGCALCGAGINLWQVVLGRAIGGLGGAGMTSLVSVLIADSVPVRDIASWRSYVNIASVVGRSAGGPIGGFLADTIGWRWSFYVQCPLAIIALILVAWRVKSPATPDPSGATDGHIEKGKLGRIDFLGSISLALAIVGFLLVLDLGGQKLSWTHPYVWSIFASAAISSIAFVLVEAFVAREPIFPLRLLVHRDVILSYLLQALQGVAQFGVMYTVPLYFQVTAGVSVSNAGAHLVPAFFGNAIGGLLTGTIVKRTASYKLLTLFGTICASICYLLLVLTWRGDTAIWKSLYIFPGGFGTGIVQSTSFVGLAAGIEESQMAIASTGIYLSANIGMLAGASLSSNILQSSLRKGLNQGLSGFEDKDQIIAKSLSDLEFVKSLDGRLREVVVGCYVRSFEYTHIMSLAAGLVATVVVFTWKEHKL